MQGAAEIGMVLALSLIFTHGVDVMIIGVFMAVFGAIHMIGWIRNSG